MPEFADYANAFESVKLERSSDGILEVTLHNQGGPFNWDEKSDTQHRGGHGGLGEAIAQIARDSANRVVIITGAGDVFSSQPASSSDKSKQRWRGDARYWDDLQFHGTNLLLDLIDIPGPVIFCLNGPAYRHFEFPFTGDIVLAADDALIQDLGHFPNGVVPGDGGGLIIPFLLGGNRGRYFHLTGQQLSAKELLAFGLVHEVMPREQLLPRARELAADMIKKNPLALRHTRLVLTAPLRSLLQEHLRYVHALEALAAIDATSS